MIRFKVFLNYLLYWFVFAVVFLVMFALFAAAAVGIPLGIMLVIYGAAALMFNEDLIITELAPPVMLFGGLALMFLTLSGALCAVKLGYFVSRRFLKVKRRCDRLREWIS